MSSGVYFAQAIDIRGPIKIGHAANIGARLLTLQTACPWPLRCIGIIEELHRFPMIQLENELHRRFREFRMRGEWFLPAREILCAIEEECDYNLLEYEAWDIAAYIADASKPPDPEKRRFGRLVGEN